MPRRSIPSFLSGILVGLLIALALFSWSRCHLVDPNADGVYDLRCARTFAIGSGQPVGSRQQRPPRSKRSP